MKNTELNGNDLLRLTYATLRAMRDSKYRIQDNDGSENFPVPEEYGYRISARLSNRLVIDNISLVLHALNLFAQKTDEIRGAFEYQPSTKTLRYFGNMDLKGALAKIERTIEEFVDVNGLDISSRVDGRGA